MEQALVLASVVLGVAIAFELEHFNKVVRAKNVKWHWAQPLFATFVLLTMLAFWWSVVSSANGVDPQDGMSLGSFLPIMVMMILLALLAAVSFPDAIPDEGLDLAEYYQENRVYQWSLFVAYFLIVHIGYVVRTVREASSLNDVLVVIPDSVALGLFALMIFARKWWQVALGFAVFSFIPVVWATRLVLR
ncbi:MAG: hypothetical protein AAF494_08425 [Pseudomonadota bacterium]